MRGSTGGVLVDEVSPFCELQLIDLEGKLEEPVSLVDRLPDAFRIHAPEIKAPVQTAEARARRTANDDVRLFFLYQQFCLGSVGVQEKGPAALVAVLAQVERLAKCQVKPWQLCELGCHPTRRIQL